MGKNEVRFDNQVDLSSGRIGGLTADPIVQQPTGLEALEFSRSRQRGGAGVAPHEEQYLTSLAQALNEQRGSEKIPILLEIAEAGQKASNQVRDVLHVLQETQVANITVAALKTLAAIGVRGEAVSALLRTKLLGDELHDVRLAAAETLGVLGEGKEDLRALKRSSEVDTPEIKKTAELALELVKFRERLPKAEKPELN